MRKLKRFASRVPWARLFVLLILSLACCFATAIEPQTNPEYDGGALRKANSLSDVTAGTARTNLDVYSKDESDALAAQGTLRYYLQEASSGLATDGKGIELAATSPVTLASESPTLGTTIALLDQWITATGTPAVTMLDSGVYEVIGYFSKSGLPTVTLIYELWVVRTDGSAGELIASSSIITLPTGTVTQSRDIANITVSSAVTILATDRLLLKLYGYQSAAPATAFAIWYGGAVSSYFGVSISPRNFLRTDGSNPNTAATVRTNLGLGTLSTQAADNAAITGGVATLTALDCDDVDGVDVSAASAAVTAHLASSTNPHGTTLRQTGVSTLAGASFTASVALNDNYISGDGGNEGFKVSPSGTGYYKGFNTGATLWSVGATTGTVATFTVATWSLTANTYCGTIFVEVVGSNVTGQSERWAGEFSLVSNGSAITVTPSDTITGSTTSTISTMADVTFTIDKSGTSCSLLMYMASANARYMITTRYAGYGMNLISVP